MKLESDGTFPLLLALIVHKKEFDISDLKTISEFILENSRRATIERIAALPKKSASGELTVDGFEHPITLKVKIIVHKDKIISDFTGSSGLDKKGINCTLVYT